MSNSLEFTIVSQKHPGRKAPIRSKYSILFGLKRGSDDNKLICQKSGKSRQQEFYCMKLHLPSSNVQESDINKKVSENTSKCSALIQNNVNLQVKMKSQSQMANNIQTAILQYRKSNPLFIIRIMPSYSGVINYPMLHVFLFFLN